MLINNSCHERDASSYDEETLDSDKHYEFALLRPTETCVIDGFIMFRDNRKLCRSIMRPDERYEFCFLDDWSPSCMYNYSNKYIIRNGAKHYVITCGISIFNKKESIINFCKSLIYLFANGEFWMYGDGNMDFTEFDEFYVENHKYDTYSLDGEWRKVEKVETGGGIVKMKSDAPQYNFYKEVGKWCLIWLTTLFVFSFLVGAVFYLL